MEEASSVISTVNDGAVCLEDMRKRGIGDSNAGGLLGLEGFLVQLHLPKGFVPAPCQRCVE